MISIASAIIGHMVGDYIAQNDSMARDKKTDSVLCAFHCAIWALSVCVFAQWASAEAATFLFITHFLIDRWNFVKWFMWKNGQEGFLVLFGPWSGIVVDNTFHLVTIFIAAQLFS